MEYKLVMRILVKETMTWYRQICKFSDTRTEGRVYLRDQAVKCIMYKFLLKLTAALFAGVMFDKLRRAPAFGLNQQTGCREVAIPPWESFTGQNMSLRGVSLSTLPHSAFTGARLPNCFVLSRIVC